MSSGKLSKLRRHLSTLVCESLENRFLLSSDLESSHVSVSLPEEHQAAIELVPVIDATHIAVEGGGRWSNAKTWVGGQVPDDNARVHVPAASTVVYDIVSDVEIDTMRVDGTFQIDASIDTRLIVDTIVGTMSSEIYVGTEEVPIAGDVTAELVFSTNGEVDRTWDPSAISRGLISMGRVEMFGQFKENTLALSTTPLAGDDRLKFDIDVRSQSVNWEIGDRLVLTGTYWDESGSHEDNTVSHDEELEIAGFGNQGQTVFFRNITNATAEQTSPSSLMWNHDPPQGYDLEVYAANLTRNVVVRSQDPNAAPANRGHVMFLDSHTDIHYASFYALGRTDKSQLVTSGEDIFGERIEEYTVNTNPRGRYPIHIHQTGTDTDDRVVFVRGSVVVGSPGWGYAVHGSKARLEDNVSYDVFGAHYVTEAGDELASFVGNIAIKSPGLLDEDAAHLLTPKRNEKGRRLDFGSRGIGFWIHRPGSVRHVDNNVVTGVTGPAFVVYGRTDKLKGPEISVENVHPAFRHIAGRSKTIASWNVPIFSVKNNSAFNAQTGLLVRGHLRDDRGLRAHGHDLHTNVVDFEAWNVREFGVFVSYASSLTLSESMILGARLQDSVNRGKSVDSFGVFISKSGRNIILDDVRVEGFMYGATLAQTAGQGIGDVDEAPFGAAEIHGGYFANNGQHLRASMGRLTNSPKSPAAINNDAPFAPWSVLGEIPYFEPVEGNSAPVATFEATAAGGLAVELDGSGSYDADYVIDPDVINASDNTIAFFTWDVNNDGIIDTYGRRPTFVFDQPGTYDVTLTVYDLQGATDTVTNHVVVVHADAVNVLKDGGFTHTTNKNWGRARWYDAFAGSNVSDSGWWLPGKTNWQVVNGRAMVIQDAAAPGLVQVAHDRRIHQGTQQLSFDAVNTGGSTLRVLIWGASGHFKVSNWNNKAPFAAGPAFSTASQLLLDESVDDIPDWRSFQFNVDLGDGFEFIVVKVWARALQGTTGVDNLSISSVVNPGDLAGPQVTNVLVNSPDWAAEYRALIPGGDPDGYLIPTGVNQTTTLPWDNIREIIVEFNEPVTGSGPDGVLMAKDFRLRGMIHGDQAIFSPVHFDPKTNRARVAVADSLQNDHYLLTVDATAVGDLAGNALDGEFEKHQLGISGDGVPGGNFSFDFSVMPGDVNGDGKVFDATEPAVTLSDHLILAASWMRTHADATYNWRADANGDLRISPADLLILVTNWMQVFSTQTPLPATGDESNVPTRSSDCEFYQAVDLLLEVYEEDEDRWVESGGDDRSAVKLLKEAIDHDGQCQRRR